MCDARVQHASRRDRRSIITRRGLNPLCDSPHAKARQLPQRIPASKPPRLMYILPYPLHSFPPLESITKKIPISSLPPSQLQPQSPPPPPTLRQRPRPTPRHLHLHANLLHRPRPRPLPLAARVPPPPVLRAPPAGPRRSESAPPAHQHGADEPGVGYGASACPGRFFAALAMKLILAHLLVHYEFRFPEGQAARPANVHVDERIWPDREQRVGFRGREPAGGGCFGCWEQKLMDRVYWWWWWWLRKAHTS